MKNWLLAAIFVVTWNENELKVVNDPCPPPEFAVYCVPPEPIYIIETTTHTINLATQKDVDLFIGEQISPLPWNTGIIGMNSFNIQVKEEGR